MFALSSAYGTTVTFRVAESCKLAIGFAHKLSQDCDTMKLWKGCGRWLLVVNVILAAGDLRSSYG